MDYSGQYFFWVATFRTSVESENVGKTDGYRITTTKSHGLLGKGTYALFVKLQRSSEVHNTRVA